MGSCCLSAPQNQGCLLPLTLRFGAWVTIPAISLIANSRGSARRWLLAGHGNESKRKVVNWWGIGRLRCLCLRSETLLPALLHVVAGAVEA